MNLCDSEVMAGLLTGDGYEMAGDVSSADVVLFNTCSVRRHAEDRVWSELGRVGKLKRKRPGLILGVCGCMAQKEGVNILNRAPYVDLVCGTYHFGEISQLLERIRREGRRIVDVGKTDVGMIGGRLPRDGRVKAWVSIMRGCNNWCAYCVVPYLRGRERSRPLDEVVGEIEGLVGEGYKEVTLLGQNVNSYRGLKNRDSREGERENKEEEKVEVGRVVKEEAGFADLLKEVNEIDGIERVRFVTSHPQDVTEEMLKVVSQLEKICEHLHLPLQAGSDKILKRMKRGYTREFYRDLIEKARRIIPGVSITTDLIVGFPGEEEKDFQDTFNLVKEIEFDGAFIYKYSHRPGTAAAKMDDDIPEQVKKDRLAAIEQIQKKSCRKKNEQLIDADVEVLVEGQSKREPLKVSGRTRTNKIVVFKGEKDIIGQLIRVRVTEVSSWTLYGENTN